jgi:hypothetical protein
MENMKKFILIIAAFGIGAIHSNAQESQAVQEGSTVQARSPATQSATDFREKLQFGLKVGVNYANVYSATGEELDTDPKFGLVGGLFLAIPIGKYMGVQPEILLSQKGFHAEGILLGTTYEMTRTTTYVDIPLMFQLKPSEFFTLVAGPQFSYLIRKKDVFANATSTIEQEEEFENEDLNKNIMGFIGGFDVNTNHLVLSGRIAWDIRKNRGDGTSTTPQYKNLWYQATVGYRFYDE